MYSQIYNPKTKRNVNISGKIGRTVLLNYLNQLGGETKKDILEKSEIYAPERYFSGLTKEETKKRLERMKKGTKMSHKDPDAYRDFETDFRDGVRIKTRPSRYTKQWEKYFPNAKSLRQKSRKTGVPLNILEKVNEKGMAAWRTGHRPGANIHQWGYARVHSFLVKGKTFYTTDRKLALRAMKNKKAKKWFDSIEGLCDGSRNKNKNNWCKSACKRIRCYD